MGASVQPIQPDPGDVARIQANVAKMRAAGAPESDVVAYLQHEDAQANAGPTTPTPDTGLNLRNIGRSVTQGATFGFGDELGLTNRAKENAFKADHPIADFLAKLGGGMVGPIAATMAAPELATTLGGATLLGGTTGALSGAGEADGSMSDRVKGAVTGGLLGAAGGAGTYGLAKGAGALGSTIIDRMHPERAVWRAAASLLDPSVSARLAQVDAIAPGGSSIATAAVPKEGDPVSRFLPMLRAVGANEDAARATEAHLGSQRVALNTARKALGAKMDALNGSVPVDKQGHSVLSRVAEILGPKTPEVTPGGTIPGTPDTPPLTTAQSPPPDLRTAIDNFWTRQAVAAKRGEGTVAQRMARESLERHAAETEGNGIFGSRLNTAVPGTPERVFPPAVDVQDLRDALSRLRFMERQAVKKGVDANGVTLHDIQTARAGLQSYLYDKVPAFADLDKPYAIASRELSAVQNATKTVQRSRANYAGNQAYGATSGSLGGSLPAGRHGVVMSMLDKIFTNKAGAADAVSRLIATPGGPALVDQILSNLPKAAGQGARRFVPPVTAAAIPAMRGLLFPQQQP